jgi:hypothetical protein
LFEVVVRPRKATSFEPRFEGSQNKVVQVHLSLKKLRYYLGSQIIRRRSKPACAYGQIAQFSRLSKCPEELLAVVTNFENGHHLDAGQRQLIGYNGGIGINDSSRRKFVASAKNDCSINHIDLASIITRLANFTMIWQCIAWAKMDVFLA